jgi:hypothetical protein
MSEDRNEFDVEAETARVREEAMTAPTPGQDPDSQQRLAKHLAAAGVKIPAGLSVDPITEEDRVAYVEKTSPVATAAKARQAVAEASADDSNQTDSDKAGSKPATAEARAKAPEGRSTKPTQRT